MSATTATDLSQILSNVKEKIESNTAERKQLADSLREISTQAQRLLADMGESSVAPVRRRGRPAGSVQKRGPGRPKGSGRRRRKMSAEARAKISAAQKKRWAAQKAGEKKK